MPDLPPFVQAVAADIYQVQLPLPFALRILNCYLLRGHNGWTIVDTGLNTAQGRETWETALAALQIAPDDITQIVLTHVHPDHYGLAGWLQEKTAVPVRLSPRELQSAQEVWQSDGAWQPAVAHYYVQCGMPEEVATAVITETNRTRARTAPHPTQMTIIEPGSEVLLGNRCCRTLLMPGHSDGQLVFYDAADKLLLCGDHILQKITPNISLWPLAEANPLGRYLQSLQELVQLDVRLLLPGHGPLMTDLQLRIAELEAHHTARLDVMETAVEAPANVYDISRRVFDFNRLSVHEKRFAVAETLAHLDYLAQAGRIKQTVANEQWLFFK
jgi:glyoxylase-like metal-dependent hydrolase (beta-lactamase superfamily II)